jgi:hypothetical protein
VSIQGPASNLARIPITPPAAPRVATTPRPAGESSSASAAEPTSLWDLLTTEERTFFQQLATVGQLTYTENTRTDERNAAAPTGQRIDVRG